MRVRSQVPTLAGGPGEPFLFSWPANLAQILDSLLLADARVASSGPDPWMSGLAISAGLMGANVVVRRAKLSDGRRLGIALVPSESWADGSVRNAAHRLKSVAGTLGRRVVLVLGTALDREPRTTNSITVAGCVGAAVLPTDRMRLLAALLEAGGGMPLADAAEFMAAASDPVASVLAMVARRDLAIDLDQVIGPWTEVRPVGLTEACTRMGSAQRWKRRG